MKDFYSSFSNRTKAIYLAWVFLHFFLLLSGAGSNYFPESGIFPLSTYYYNFSSFLFYAITPIFIIIIIRLWRKDKTTAISKSTIDKPTNTIISIEKNDKASILSEKIQFERETKLLESETDQTKKQIIEEKKTIEVKTINYTPKNILILRTSMIATIFFISSLYYFLSPEPKPDDPFMMIGAIFGTAIVVGIIPAIMGLIRMIRKRKPSSSNYTTYFIIIFITSFIMFLIRQSNYNVEKILEKNQTYNQNRIEEKIFDCPEYSILFPSEPIKNDKYTPFEGKGLHSITAELVIPDEKSLLRAEYAELNSEFIKGVNKRYAYKQLNEYAVNQQLKSSTFGYTENVLGKIASVKGYKTLVDDFGVNVKMTFESITYYGKSYCMILYVGCPSYQYPTPSITKFKDSIKRL